jgi:hypothetical protein
VIDGHQSLCVGERQRANHRRIDHAEDGCVRANSERKGEDRNQRKSRVLAKRA